MKAIIVVLLSMTAIFRASANDFTLTTDTLISGGESVISYSYSWDKVKSLRDEQMSILGLNHNDKNLQVLTARFTFLIKGNINKFNDSFFSRKDVLEALAGMRIQEERKNLYSINRKKFGIEFSANVRTMLNLDYLEYQNALDYIEPESESFVSRQVTDNFNRSLKSADIITHVAQHGEFLKFTIDSFTVLTKKESSSFLSFAIKKILVSKMKSQILRVPHIYMRK